ncbi:MAG: acetylornithine transaminase, partial [Myxococcota bacterium]
LAAAIKDQAERLLHTSNLFLNEPSVELAERITEVCFADRVFFCNSGAEANESALKLARRYHWSRKRPEKNRIVTFRGGFHGRTYGALAATAQPKYHAGFAPMPEGFDPIDFGDLEQLERVVGPTTAAVLVEPTQGEGGVNVPPEGFLRSIREVTDAHDSLLIVDEVQTGFGRTGRMFAHQYDDVVPDIMCMAKGIAAGLPLGGIAARAEVAEALVPGTHNTTYSGNPLACRGGLIVMETLLKPGFLEGIRARGDQLRTGLAALGGSLFADVRGRGLLLGAELSDHAPVTAKQIVEACRARGALVHVAGPSVLRLAPPLILTASEAEELLQIMRLALVDLGVAPRA